MITKRPQINSSGLDSKSSLKELREKISCSEVPACRLGRLNDKICLSESSSELFCRNGTERNFSNSFTEHASFGTFLTIRKVQLKNLFWSLPRCISGLSKVRNSLVTMINVIPSGSYLIIEAWNKHCRIRVAEKNSRILYRLIKTSFKLYWKTIKTLFKKKLNEAKSPSKAQRSLS